MSRTRPRAFTLVEIMISISILALIMIAIYAAWSAILRGTKVGLAAAAEVQRSRVALRTIEDALSTVQMFEENSRYYSFVSDTSGQDATLSLVSHLPGSFPGAGIYPDQPVRRVTFFVEAGPNLEKQLVMTQAPILMATNGDQEPYSLVLARGVSSFNLSFWDMKTSDWVEEWLSTNTLPKTVMISLGFGHAKNYSSRPEEVVTRIVSLPATTVLRAWQTPMGQGRPGVTNRGGTNLVRPPGGPAQLLPPGQQPPPGPMPFPGSTPPIRRRR